MYRDHPRSTPVDPEPASKKSNRSKNIDLRALHPVCPSEAQRFRFQHCQQRKPGGQFYWCSFGPPPPTPSLGCGAFPWIILVPLPPSPVRLFNRIRVNIGTASLRGRATFCGGLFNRCSGSTAHCLVWGRIVYHTCPTLETHGSDEPPTTSPNPTPPSGSLKKTYPYVYQLARSIRGLSHTEIKTPLRADHPGTFHTQAIVRDNPPISPPILQSSNPPTLQRMANPIYHRSRGLPYTTRTNSGVNDIWKNLAE